MMNLRINKKKTALFLFAAAMLGMWTFVVDGDSRGNAAVREKEVLGKAQIVVYKKGEKILIDPDVPYFKELQLACEEMLVPVDPGSDTPDAYLYHLYDEGYFKDTLPEVTELQEKEFVIEIIYASSVETRIKAGFGLTIADEYKILLSGFMFPLSGEWVGRNIGVSNDDFYTYVHLVSNFSDLGHFATTRGVEKTKDILFQYMIIPRN